MHFINTIMCLVPWLIVVPSSQALAIRQAGLAGVLYTLDNNPAGASIAAMGLSENGTIMGTILTPTGGNGSNGVVAPGQPAVGSTFGAHSVVAEDGFLFAVNPGSNTVSMFEIDPQNPMQPRLVGTPANTLGQFPMSLAYSCLLGQVCVLNGGAVAGVSCFSVNATVGLTPLDTSLRSISQALNQTTPPVGPFSTASDISFNPSSSALVAAIKGSPPNGTIAGSPGSLYAWPVTTQGRVSNTSVINRFPSLVLDFSVTYTNSDFDLFVVDPALGGDFLAVDTNLSMTVTRAVNITTQKAVCWSTFVPQLQAVFVIDTAAANVTVLSSIDGSIVQTIGHSGNGAIDPIVVGENLYLLTQSATVDNINLAGIQTGSVTGQVQTFVPNVPNPSNISSLLSGLAAWVP